MHDARTIFLFASLAACSATASAAELAPPEFDDTADGALAALPFTTTFALIAASGGGETRVYQQGEDNVALVTQQGGASRASVAQTGNGNHVDILQRGAGHDAAVIQEGNRNTFSLTQSGFGQQLEVHQQGDGLSVQAVQR